MIQIVYSNENSVAYSDFGVQKYVDGLCEFYYRKKKLNDGHSSDNFNQFYRVSTENFILAIRVAIHEGRLFHEDVEVIYKNKTIKFNEQGNFLNNEYLDSFFDEALDNLLDL